MANIDIIPLIIISANVLFSYKGLSNEAFFDGYKFEVNRILINKDYRRLITSGFLHVSWLHLIFNMIALYAFSGNIIAAVGIPGYLLVYFASLIGGNLLALFIHRNHPDYNAAGASGAIAGLIFATIAWFPYSGIGMIFIPIYIPGWLFGILYIAFSIYGIRSKKDNIGHEAHLGGAVTGMLLAILMRPSALVENYLFILVMLIPTITFIYLIVTRPHILMIDNLFYKEHKDHYSVDHDYNLQKVTKQQQIDAILDKINRRGVNSLSSKEKEFLKKNS